MRPMIQSNEGRRMIQQCLNAEDSVTFPVQQQMNPKEMSIPGPTMRLAIPANFGTNIEVEKQQMTLTQPNYQFNSPQFWQQQTQRQLMANVENEIAQQQQQQQININRSDQEMFSNLLSQAVQESTNNSSSSSIGPSMNRNSMGSDAAATILKQTFPNFFTQSANPQTISLQTGTSSILPSSFGNTIGTGQEQLSAFSQQENIKNFNQQQQQHEENMKNLQSEEEDQGSGEEKQYSSNTNEVLQRQAESHMHEIQQIQDFAQNEGFYVPRKAEPDVSQEQAEGEDQAQKGVVEHESEDDEEETVEENQIYPLHLKPRVQRSDNAQQNQQFNKNLPIEKDNY